VSSLDGVTIHRRLGSHKWLRPVPWGPDGWMMRAKNGDGIVIVTVSPAPGAPADQEWENDDAWIHASISRNTMPTYGDLANLHAAVWEDGWAYQMFAPPEAHVNIHERALHLWGRFDGAPVLPNFGLYGTI
jgi:hypothetical protein